MTELGKAIEERFTAQARDALDRPFVADPELDALAARLADMKTHAPHMYEANPDRKRVERYLLSKADHAAKRSPNPFVAHYTKDH